LLVALELQLEETTTVEVTGVPEAGLVLA